VSTVVSAWRPRLSGASLTVSAMNGGVLTLFELLDLM